MFLQGWRGQAPVGSVLSLIGMWMVDWDCQDEKTPTPCHGDKGPGSIGTAAEAAWTRQKKKDECHPRTFSTVECPIGAMFMGTLRLS